MKAITITNERMSQVLPANIQESELSANAKKVLAVLINYFMTSDVVNESGYLVMPNNVLRKSCSMSYNDTLAAVQELKECKLINRVAGSRRTKDQKAKASEYYINWENLEKPVVKPTFETLFAEYLKKIKTPEKPIGTANTNTIANSNYNSDSNYNSNVNDDCNTNNEFNSNKSNLLTINSINEKSNLKKTNECNTLTNKELSEETKLNLKEGLNQWLKATLPVTEES